MSSDKRINSPKKTLRNNLRNATALFWMSIGFSINVY